EIRKGKEIRSTGIYTRAYASKIIKFIAHLDRFQSYIAGRAHPIITIYEIIAITDGVGTRIGRQTRPVCIKISVRFCPQTLFDKIQHRSVSTVSTRCHIDKWSNSIRIQEKRITCRSLYKSRYIKILVTKRTS